VQVTENIDKNTIQGIIHDETNELKGMEDEEMLQVATQDNPRVRMVKRFGKDGKGRIIGIHFTGQKLPERISFWKELSMPVQKNIPPPPRCFNCQTYGHMSRTCRDDRVCWRCATVYKTKEEHDPDTCNQPMKCVNCGGNHTVASPACEQHKKEKVWARIRVEQNLTYKEAKERYPMGKLPSYAEKINANFEFGRTHYKPNGARQEENKSINLEKIMERLEKIEEAIVKPSTSQDDDEGGKETAADASDVKWKEQQQQLTELTKRMTFQETEHKRMSRQIEVQDKIIKQLQNENKNKEEQIKKLNEQNGVLNAQKENLIVENERLKINANKTMKVEIEALKAEITRLNGKLVHQEGAEDALPQRSKKSRPK